MNNKLVLIDANNLAHRFFWRFQREKRESGSNLHYGNKETSVIFSFLRELILIEKRYPKSEKIMIWDGGCMRRKAETAKAVESGLIESGYKSGRKEMEEADKESFNTQVAHLQTDILPNIAIMQVLIRGFEGDDVINTYAQKYPEREIVIISSDRDFYQCLDDKVIIADLMKDEVWTRERFINEYGFNPNHYVDYGALVGEGSGGDNIPGVKGCGDVSAKKLVKAYGSVGEILKALAVKEKRSKLEETVLNSVDIIALSYSLKRMDVLNVPDVVVEKKNPELVKKMLIEWGCVSILKHTDILSGNIK